MNSLVASGKRVLVMLAIPTALLVLPASASATRVPAWAVLGSAVGASQAITLKSEKGMTIAIPGKNVEVSCSVLSIDEGLLKSSGESSGTLLLTGCKTFLEKVEIASCKPVEPIAAVTKGKLISEGGVFYDLVGPAEGATFLTLHFSGACPLTEEWPISGSLVLKCLDASCETSQATHSLQQAKGIAGDSLTYIKSTVELVGTATAELGGAEKGGKWSAIGTEPPPGNWFEAGKALTSTKEFTGKLVKDSKFLWLSTGVEIVCKKVQITDGLFQLEGNGMANLNLTECKTFSKGVESTQCKPFEPLEAVVKLRQLSHQGATYILVSSPSGSAITIFKFKEECSLPASMSITGSTVWGCVTVACGTEASSHELEAASATLFPEDGLKFGVNVITWDIGLFLELVSKNKWSAVR